MEIECQTKMLSVHVHSSEYLMLLAIMSPTLNRKAFIIVPPHLLDNFKIMVRVNSFGIINVLPISNL